MQKLKELSDQAHTLSGISSLLSWDQETFMPSAASEARAKQMELLSKLYHELVTSHEYQSTLAALIDLETGKILAQGISEEEKAALREWRRDFVIQKALPTAFVEELTRVTTKATDVWKEARTQKNFALFEPYLQKIVDLSRQKAEYLGYEDHPYDALLDLYEPGLTSKEVEKTFDVIEKELSPFIKKAKKSGKPYKKKVPEAKQLEISHLIMEKMGFDLTKGRLDKSTHPFSSAYHPHDSRITTRLYPDTPLPNIFSTLHELGHSLYEMELPVSAWGTPLGQSVSLGIHESQSRFWETRIGLSKPFWQWAAPLLKETPEKLYKAVNQIKPSFIRVDADETTYPLHVILRFRLEKRLIEGSLKVKDIPQAWNDEMQKLLGITPPDDSQGCLQDIHWSGGAFGYFPTYLLGTIWASQLFEKMTQDHPDWEKRVSEGDFIFIRKWLADKIHRHGRRYSPLELIRNATGQESSAEPFLKYIKTKER